MGMIWSNGNILLIVVCVLLAVLALTAKWYEWAKIREQIKDFKDFKEKSKQHEDLETFEVEIPNELYARLAEQADREGISVDALASRLMIDYVNSYFQNKP